VSKIKYNGRCHLRQAYDIFMPSVANPLNNDKYGLNCY